MGIEALANRLNKKLYRRKQRAMVKKWWDDDGDCRFREAGAGGSNPLTPTKLP